MKMNFLLIEMNLLAFNMKWTRCELMQWNELDVNKSKILERNKQEKSVESDHYKN